MLNPQLQWGAQAPRLLRLAPRQSLSSLATHS
jgi:hypothetical protein